ncbi:mCG1029165, partial [Mus musculus]
ILKNKNHIISDFWSFIRKSNRTVHLKKAFTLHLRIIVMCSHHCLYIFKFCGKSLSNHEVHDKEH